MTHTDPTRSSRCLIIFLAGLIPESNRAVTADPEPFGVDDLLAYRSAREPDCQREAIKRRKVMRKARSKTKRPKLPEELERQSLAASSHL